MPSVRKVPLQELIRQSTLTQATELLVAQAALHELLRRALYLGDEQAWDAAVACLWPTVLTSIYAGSPDITPTDAEFQAAQLILHFKLRFRNRSPHHASFPSITNLLVTLLQSDFP